MGPASPREHKTTLGTWVPRQGGQFAAAKKELVHFPSISKGGKKNKTHPHMTSQSFCFPRKVPSQALPTAMSQTSQMEGRQAEPDMLPSAKYRSPTFSLPRSQQTTKRNSPIMEPEHPFTPSSQHRFPLETPCVLQHLQPPQWKLHPIPTGSSQLISGEPEMLGDMLKSKLTSLATHGCCRTTGEEGKHLCFPLRGDANSLRVRSGGSAGSGPGSYSRKVPISG